ncbi:CD3e molecule, epsilon associated protein [Danio aesculapii]|uniref:CD3e molecule, epsilon associated protein n=1 Tax=Danio aesculapii TaxID=1142201 RepID=UPI0024BF5977|nr:CD3e molecule, epsilon associated protein [Danio aesculapii]
MSDSEEEPHERTSGEQKRDSKYQCPAEFTSFLYDSSVNALSDVDKQQLWFIKAPARFDPECFDNLTLPLSGLEMVQSNGNSPQIYSVVSGGTTPSDLHLLISKGENQKLSLCSSGFSGVLKISESYGNCGETQGPIPVPAAPAPRIPDGLKQRFHPFGGSAGARIQKEATFASPTPPQKTRQDLGDGEEPKKKKKKKDKRQEEGDSQDVLIKQEETQIECDQLEISELMKEELTEEKRRKKKKVKKEKERESLDMVDASLLLKTEQLDPSHDDTEVTPKKKKKKSSRNE